jgi:hypothetical protein
MAQSKNTIMVKIHIAGRAAHPGPELTYCCGDVCFVLNRDGRWEVFTDKLTCEICKANFVEFAKETVRASCA